MRLLRTDGDDVIIALTEEELQAIERAIENVQYNSGKAETDVRDGLLDIMSDLGL